MARKKKQPRLEDFGARIKKPPAGKPAKQVPLHQFWRAGQYELEKQVRQAFSDFRPKYNVKISGRPSGRIKPSYPGLWFGVAFLKDLHRGMRPGKKKKKVKKRGELAPKTIYDYETVRDRTLEGGTVEKKVEVKKTLKQATLKGEKYEKAPEVVEEKTHFVRETVDVDVAAKVGNKVLVGEIKKLPEKENPALVEKYVSETALLHMLLLTDPRLVKKVVGKRVTTKDTLVPLIIFDRPLTKREQKAVEIGLWKAKNAFDSIVWPFETEYMRQPRIESFDESTRKVLEKEQEQRFKAEARAVLMKPVILTPKELPEFAERVKKQEKIEQEVPLFPEGPAAMPIDYAETEREMMRRITKKRPYDE